MIKLIFSFLLFFVFVSEAFATPDKKDNFYEEMLLEMYELHMQEQGNQFGGPTPAPPLPNDEEEEDDEPELHSILEIDAEVDEDFDFDSF